MSRHNFPPSVGLLAALMAVPLALTLMPFAWWMMLASKRVAAEGKREARRKRDKLRVIEGGKR